MRRFAALLVLTLPAVAAAEAGDDEHTIPPYYLVHGPRDAVELAERYEALAEDARAVGDVAREARHLALACGWRSALDGQLVAGPCARARQLAADNHLLDVVLTFEVEDASIAGALMDFPRMVALLLDVIERGRAIDPASPEAQPVRGAHVGLAVARLLEGRYDEWLAELDEAHRMSDGRDDWEAAGADLWSCWGYPMIGDLARARQACDRAQAYVDTSHDWFLGMWLAFAIGQLDSWAGRDEAALADYRRALELAERRGGIGRRVITRAVVASMLIRLGRLDEARQNLEAAEHEVPILLAAARPMVEHQWGRLEMAQGNYAAAATHFELSKHSVEHDVAVGAYRGLASAKRRLGDLAGARAALEEVIHVIEAERTTVDGASQRASFFALNGAVYADLVSVLYDQRGDAAAAQALDVAEAGRARALLDALAVAQVAGTAARPLAAAEIQGRLAPDEVLIEFVTTDDRLLAITVTRDRLRLLTLPGAGSADNLAARVAFFRQLVEETDEEPVLALPAARLYADILAPALTLAPPEAHTLIIAADGPLVGLPFDALVDEHGPLVGGWDIALVPSASVLETRADRAPPSAAALVVAAPAVAAMAPLPAARAEAEVVRQRLDGEVVVLAGVDASRARLAQVGVDRFAVLHFASHAQADETLPLRSALVLAPSGGGQTDDGMWRADEIYGLSLRADLVVLSACGTARGAETLGEGPMSLARAFLYAGAGATVATLWDVDDDAGPAFADALYRRLGAATRLGPAAAAAKRELRRRGAPPRAWASYIVTGSPRVAVRVAAAAAQPPWLAGGLGVAALLAAVATVVRFRRQQRTWFLVPTTTAAGFMAVYLFMSGGPGSPPVGSGRRLLRGDSAGRLELTASNGRVAWNPVPSADGYRVTFFSADGRPVGTPAAAVAPVEIPAEARGGWLRVDARARGLPVATSAVSPVR